MQENPLAQLRKVLFLQGKLRHDLQHMLHGIMTIDMELAFIFSLIHKRSNLADDPDDTKHMIRVSMRDKQVMKILIVHSGLLHLLQNPVAASGICNKIFAALELQQKACIEAFRYHCRARAQKNKFFHKKPLFLIHRICRYL